MEDHIGNSPSFLLDSSLDPDSLGNTLRNQRRLQIPNFLEPSGAERLYEHLVRDVQWRSLAVANDGKYGTAPRPADDRCMDVDDKLRELAYEGARRGFASLYDANCISAEDALTSLPAGSLLAEFARFLNSPATIDFFRQVSGNVDIAQATVQATRFRPGHFLTFHDATFSADSTCTRVLGYTLNLTPEWKPEWGGLLEFRAADVSRVEAHLPCFNSIDVFDFPQGHWISMVSPCAHGPRYAVSGALFA